MTKLLFLLLLLPAMSHSQFKRSATELAKENVHEYLTNKLFKSDSYQSVFFGQLTAEKTDDRETAWFIEHKFIITEIERIPGGKDSVQRSYRFVFYFDDKMNVLRADNLFE